MKRDRKTNHVIDAELRARFHPTTTTTDDVERIWAQVSFSDPLDITPASSPKRRFTMRTGVLVAVCLLATSVAAIASPTRDFLGWIRPAPAEDDSRLPDSRTLDAIGIFAASDAARMTDDEYQFLADMIEPTDGSQIPGRITKDQLPPRDDSRVLLDKDNRRISALRTKNGEMCYVASVAPSGGSRTSGCSFGLLKSGVFTSGEWTLQGLVLFGFLRDDAKSVKVRTNHGDIQDVILGRNSFVWDSHSPDRSTRAVSVLVKQPDGVFEEIPLPYGGKSSIGTPQRGGLDTSNHGVSASDR